MFEIIVPDGWYVLYCESCGLTVSWTDKDIATTGDDFYGTYIYASTLIVGHIHD